MNPTRQIFLGDITINGTTYNFGLYGTTNGQPNVPSTATYGGNGNQSLPGGGGSGSTTPVRIPVPEAVGDVVDIVKNVVANEFE